MIIAAIVSALGIGGLGAAAIFIPGFGAILAAAAKSAFDWLSRRSPAELVALALGVALAIDHLGLIEAHRHSAKVEVQLTSANNALATERANEAALRKSIADQNAAVQKLADTSKAEQAEAAKALVSAQERVSEAEAVAARLKAQSRPAAGKSNRTGICEPDAAVKEQWQ